MRRDADGKESAALVIIKVNAHLPYRVIADKLHEAGIERSIWWVGAHFVDALRLPRPGVRRRQNCLSAY